MKDSVYVTDYFYFSVKQVKRNGKEVLAYCSGTNLDRFLPMSRGRLGLGSNPILSGLKLVKYDVCKLALSKGAMPRDQPGSIKCADITPSEGTWYIEPLLIENPEGLVPDEIVAFCVDNYVRRVAAWSLQECEVPDALLLPGDMQARLDILCRAA